MSSCYSAQHFSTNMTNCTFSTTVAENHYLSLFCEVPFSRFLCSSSFCSVIHTQMKSLILSSTILTLIYTYCRVQFRCCKTSILYSFTFKPFHLKQSVVRVLECNHADLLKYWYMCLRLLYHKILHGKCSRPTFLLRYLRA